MSPFGINGFNYYTELSHRIAFLLFTDGRSEAETLAEKVRVLCWILTAPQFLDHRARQVKDTWGKRCNVILFMSSVKNDSFPTVGLNVSEGRRHLIAKTMSAFRYVYENYFHEADWFMKADDDTYVIVENLRYFLSGEDPDEPVYFGQHFKAVIKNWGFLSGGAGYIISKAALRLFGEKNSVCPKDGGGEDVAFSLCMKKLGVRLGNSTDVLGRSRFHCFDPASHVSGNYRRWYLHYDIHGAKKVSANLLAELAYRYCQLPFTVYRSMSFSDTHSAT